MQQVSISTTPEISAIYFGLLQSGYDFYSFERDQAHNRTIQSFLSTDSSIPFFRDVKQTTCEVYPYWPRAAMLETSSFFLNSTKDCFSDFSELKRQIDSAVNISDIERSPAFWEWLLNFPAALRQVIDSTDFQRYLQWEAEWTVRQNIIHSEALREIGKVLNACTEHYHSSVVTDISIVLNPIKCVYSADYHLIDSRFIFSSGKFSKGSVIHEFLHHIVHPFVDLDKEEIIRQKRIYPGLDPSYYLSGDDDGQLNAFEEYFVRTLTDAILSDHMPDDLNICIAEILTLP